MCGGGRDRGRSYSRLHADGCLVSSVASSAEGVLSELSKPKRPRPLRAKSLARGHAHAHCVGRNACTSVPCRLLP